MLKSKKLNFYQIYFIFIFHKYIKVKKKKERYFFGFFNPQVSSSLSNLIHCFSPSPFPPCERLRSTHLPCFLSPRLPSLSLMRICDCDRPTQQTALAPTPSPVAPSSISFSVGEERFSVSPLRQLSLHLQKVS